MKPNPDLKSPFTAEERPLVWPYAAGGDGTLEKLYCFATSVHSDQSKQSVWVRSELPFVIKLTLADIQEAVKEGGKLDSNCLNLAIRNIAAEDIECFRNTEYLGWRHYVGTDWTEHVARGCDQWNTTYLKTSFSRHSVLYSASSSHLVLIPVFCNDHWTLYAFSMTDRKVSILDSLPDATQGGSDPAARHESLRLQVCSALNFTMGAAIDMSENDFRRWTYEFPEVPRQHSRNDSGFFMFNNMRLWDGRQLFQSYPTDPTDLRMDFLACTLACKDNKAGLPHKVSLFMQNISGFALLEAARECNVKEFHNIVDEAAEHITTTTEKVIDIPAEPVAIVTSSATSNGNGNGNGVRANQTRLPAIIGKTPLSTEAMSSIPRLLSLFLKVRTVEGDGLLHLAARCRLGSEKFVKAVFIKVGWGAPSDASPQFAGCDRSQTARLAKFLRARNHRGETCLHEAVRSGNANLVDLLVKIDKQLNDETSPTLVQIMDDNDVSPLYLATTLRRADTIIILTDTKRSTYSPPSYTGPGGKTAMHAAVLLDKDLSDQLLGWNPDLINIADESGSTPLHFLASNGGAHIVELLLSETDSVRINLADSKGSFPIHVAAANGRVDVIKQFVHFSADCIWSLDASGQSILHIAVQEKQVEVVKYICRDQRFEGILNLRDLAGNTAIHSAVQSGNQWVFFILLRNKQVILSVANNEGHTPLDLAVLSLPAGLRFRQVPRQWILYDLVLAGADLGTCRWDHLSSKKQEADKEHFSRTTGKFAGLLAVCSVLILGIAFAAAFNVIQSYNEDKATSSSTRTRSRAVRAHAFRAFIVSDAMAFLFSTATTFHCTFAGSSAIDRRTRLLYLSIGLACLRCAAVSMVAVFMLGLYVVVEPVNLRIAIAACAFALLAVAMEVTPVIMMFFHVFTLYQRLGLRAWWRALFRNRHRLPFRHIGLVGNSLSTILFIFGVCGAIAGFSYL